MKNQQKAFPIVVPKENFQYADDGMDLRDYFAAKAMQGILANPSHSDQDGQIVEDSYKIADLMMEARK